MFPFPRLRPLPSHTRRPARAARRAQLALQPLEGRITPYALSGYSWANPNVSFSFMPDGTAAEGSTSSLFALLNATAPTATWQREVARALQSWAEVSQLNFRLVADDGSPSGTSGIPQGDTRFGDIRLGAAPEHSFLGYTYYPAGTVVGGDAFLNTAYTYQVGATYDVYSVMLHEFGHALGLGHSVAGTAMYGTITGVYSGLSADDIAGIQAIYGTRRPDAYDAAAANDTLGTAIPLGLSGGGLSVTADLTGRADADFYRVTAPGDSLTVSVDARNRSLLAPKVSVYDAAGAVVGSATADYGQAATLTLTGLTAGQTYYLAADGATDDALGAGAYLLTAQFGGPAAPAAPTGLAATATSSTQVNLSWQDNATDEDGYRVERSTDGVNFTFVANAPAGATGYAVTGLAAGTTYSFRVRAYNAGGDSAWSNTAQATTPAAAPPPLSPDRFEADNTVATARNLGKLTSTSQPGLTVHNATDVDYYAFTPRASGALTVSIQFANAAGNLDLFVYDSRQRLLAAGTSAADTEAVTASFAAGKKYFIKVIGQNGATNAYDLSIAPGSAGLAPRAGAGPADPVAGAGRSVGRVPTLPGAGAVPPGVVPADRTAEHGQGPDRSDRTARTAGAVRRAAPRPGLVERVLADPHPDLWPAVQPGPGLGWTFGDPLAGPDY